MRTATAKAVVTMMIVVMVVVLMMLVVVAVAAETSARCGAAFLVLVRNLFGFSKLSTEARRSRFDSLTDRPLDMATSYTKTKYYFGRKCKDRLGSVLLVHQHPLQFFPGWYHILRPNEESNRPNLPVS